MSRKLLVVDDEVNFLKVVRANLKRWGFSVDTASSGEEALTMLDSTFYDLILSDYRMSGIDGETLMDMVRQKNPVTPFILMTGYGSIEHAVDAMRNGAYTYLTKPLNFDVLLTVLRGALHEDGPGHGDYIDDNYQYLNIIGKSRAIKDVFSMINRVSKTDANVLILGESGTGKELIARGIHYSSLKAVGPFIPLDCTTIPGDLIESELFGHARGAFTCAYESKIGLLEMADGGTIFLDEIGDLDFGLQKKLLRFLQEKEFYRLGGKDKIKVDARVLAATNRNLEEAVQKGDFRADLYYRLNVITINAPPLRERRDDIPLLANHFLKVFGEKNKKPLRGFDEPMMEILKSYDWPGNVRELANTVERAVILCPYDSINEEYLPRKLRLLAGEDSSESDGLNLLELERRVITKALHRTSWNQTKSAELLGVSRKQLRTKMKNLGLPLNKPK